MAVSLAYGRDKLEPTYVSKEYSKAMEVGYRVFDEFKAHFGSVRRRDVHVKLFNRAYNLRDPAEFNEFISSGAVNKCADVVALAARVATKAIVESKQR